MKILVFSPSLFGLQNNFWPFFQLIWPSDGLNIQNQSKLSYFEAILSLTLIGMSSENKLNAHL
jgi:hypothetical protein